jgi:hypothetical protein
MRERGVAAVDKQMDIFVAVPSIKKTIRDDGVSLTGLPEFAR